MVFFFRLHDRKEVKKKRENHHQLLIRSNTTATTSTTSNAQCPLGDPLLKLAHVFPAFAKYKFQRRHPRLAIVSEPITAVVAFAPHTYIGLYHALARGIFLEPQNLLWVELEVVLDDVVVQDVVAPAFGAGVVAGVEGVFGGTRSVTGGIGGCVVQVRGQDALGE